MLCVVRVGLRSTAVSGTWEPLFPGVATVAWRKRARCVNCGTR